MKNQLRILFFILIMLVSLLVLSSCNNYSYSDGTLRYRVTDGGYEVVGVEDESVTEINIPSFVNFKRVVAIGEYAFSNNSTIVSITIPNSVKIIKDYAIISCSALEEVTLPQGIERVGMLNFYYCDNLNYAEYDNGKYVGNKKNPYLVLVGVENREITTCEVNKKCKIISTAFYSCNNLKSVKIPYGVKVIDTQAFSYCSDLMEVTIPKSVHTIGASAFNNCNSLKQIKIPGSVKTIEEGAFSMCNSLLKVELPNNLKNIGLNIFSGSESLALNEYEGGLYLGNEKNPFLFLVRLSSVEATEVNLHKDTKYIDLEEAFAYYYIAVADIKVPEENRYFKSINGNLYSKDGKTLIRYASAKKEESFSVPDGVKKISALAFADSTNLKTIYIPNSVNELGNRAFSNCTSLENINIPNRISVISERLFSSCSSLKNIDIPKGVVYIGDSAFWACYSLESIDIPNRVRHIGESAFYHCRSLKSVIIPNSVLELESSAFRSCENLEEIVIGKGITKIDYFTFTDCTSLKKITISDNVTFIQDSAFNDCIFLDQIIFQGTIEQWRAVEKYMFPGNYTVVCTDGSLDKYGNKVTK